MTAIPLKTPDMGELPYLFMDAVSLGATVSSNPVDISYVKDISVHLLCTGTPAGTFDIQGSVKPNPETTDWVSVTLPTVPTAVGADINFLINLSTLGFSYLRVVYTRTSGTGAVSAYIYGKGQ